MASINQIIQQIRTAVFGKDVRENIALGIETCYTDIEECKETCHDDIEECKETCYSMIGQIPRESESLFINIVKGGYRNVSIIIADGHEEPNSTRVATEYLPWSTNITTVYLKLLNNFSNMLLRVFFYGENKLDDYLGYYGGDIYLDDIVSEEFRNMFVNAKYVRFMFATTNDSSLLPETIENGLILAYYADDLMVNPETSPLRNDIIQFNWTSGSVYVESGMPYNPTRGSGVIRYVSVPLFVKQNERVTIKYPTGTINLRVYKYQSDGTYIGYDEYDSKYGCGFIVADEDLYVIFNIISLNNGALLKDIYVYLNGSNGRNEINSLITDRIGMFDYSWNEGGIYVASGKTFESLTRINSDYIDVSNTHHIYVYNPNKKFIIRVFSYTSNDGEDSSYIPNLEGTSQDDYRTSFDIELKDEIKYVRLQARINENTESTNVAAREGYEIVVYTNSKSDSFTYENACADYILNESNSVIDRLPSNNLNKFMILALSDIHYWYNSRMVMRSLMDMKNAVEYIKMMADIDLAICFGDIIYRVGSQYLFSDGKNEILASTKILNDTFGNMTQLRLVGNHDPNVLEYGKYFTMDDMYKYIGSYNREATVDPLNPTGSYGYLDNTEKKIRFVYLNTSDYSDEGAPSFDPSETNPNVNSHSVYIMSYQQINWFKDVINMNDVEDPTEWTLIVNSHIPIDGDSALIRNIGMNVFDIVKARSDLSSHSFTVKNQSLSVDYTGSSALKDIICINGHNHDYGLSVKNGIARIEIPNALPGRNSSKNDSKIPLTKDSTAFCLLEFDLYKKIIYAVHYGKGYDRILHYGVQNINTDTYLSAEQVNTSYSSSDSTILTVSSNGLVHPISTGNAYVTGIDNQGNIEMWNIKIV